MSSVKIEHVYKRFGEVTVLSDFDELIEDKEFVTLLGPSGCGKTTMLRIIAGFEKTSSGSVRIDEEVVSSDSEFVPPEKRDIGMVFQSYAVWPHMNVFDNIAYPLKIKKLKKEVIKEKVERILKVVHLSQYKERYPSELSGGQQQRVALGRALVAEPRLLLLDEPLSNLDAKLRESMRFEIKEIQKKFGITVIYVTHDQTEAMAMSDKIIVMNKGVIQQIGKPMEIYKSPSNKFVADFVGKVNFFKGYIENGEARIDEIGYKFVYDGPVKGKAVITIRPEEVILSKEEGDVKGCIQSLSYLGDICDFGISIGEMTMRVIAEAEAMTRFGIGDAVHLGFKHILVFEDDGSSEHMCIAT